MLFGNQPFIADMTEKAVRDGSSVAAGMASRFAARADVLERRLHSETPLTVHQPDAGMFALVNVSGIAMDGDTYAWDLLEHGVSVMPGSAFGESLKDWVRVALTIDDSQFATALDRIVAHANLSKRNVA
jgi:arginine:pyruvate transaminase